MGGGGFLISLAKNVETVLHSTGAAVWYFHPQSWIRLPAVSWRESQCRELSQADGREHLAELSYAVDVWGRSPAENAALAADVDAKMAAMRMRRESSEDLYEADTGLHHRALRYRCVADAAGNIYQ